MLRQVDKTLKHIKLPKDPLDTDNGDSDSRSSCASKRSELKKRLADMPDPKLDFKQGGVKILRSLDFKMQAVDSRVYNPDTEQPDPYSPTGNSWRQSDIDSEYHRFDPKRYKAREPQKNPQESETFSQLKIRDGAVIDTNTVTSFGDLVQRRMIQDRALKKKKTSNEPSLLTVTRSVSKKSKSRKKNTNSDMTGIMTKREIIELNRKIMPEDFDGKNKPQTRNFYSRKHTVPEIDIQDVERANLREILATREGGNKTTFFDDQELNMALNTVVQLKKNRTIDISLPPSQLTLKSNQMPSSSTNPIEQQQNDQRGSPYLSPWQIEKQHQNLDMQGSTIQILGDKKELTSQKSKSPMHHESQFSFRGQANQSPQFTAKQPPSIREGTPERILREFNEKAKAYKMGLRQTKDNSLSDWTGPGQTWRDLMFETKDEWELTTADLYNPSPSVLYDAYTFHLSHTIAAKISQIAGRNMRINLSQGKGFKKIQVNVTTVHQTKFRLTKFGNGFGYGTTDKLSPEDAFLKDVFEKASSDVRDKRRMPGQKETLASLVPAIVKKAPKPVTDSLQALHLTCRRGVTIDRNGLPFLVEKDPYSRDKHMNYLKNKMLNQNSAKSFHTQSMYTNTKQSYNTASKNNIDLGSMANLTEVSHSTSRKQVYKSVPPSKNKVEVQNQYLKKVDHLITKFDQSFRENELQQQQIIEAQKELTFAKNQILEKIHQKEDAIEEEGQTHSMASGDSYKKDSCFEPSDDESRQPNNNQHEETGAENENKKQMQATFQTNDEREEYTKMLDNLSRKYSNLNELAIDALQNEWDTRKELRKVSQPHKSTNKLSSIQSNKSTFKRNRRHDKVILNERSGDLMSMSSSAQQMLSPQDIYKLMEKQKIQNSAKTAKMMPSFKSKADLQLSIKQNESKNNKISLMDLKNSKKRILPPSKTQNSYGITKGESQISDNYSLGIQKSNPKIQYRPVPMESYNNHQKSKSNVVQKEHQQLLSTQNSNSKFRFDINEASAREKRNAEMNQSIMSQLTIQQNNGIKPPKAQLPKKNKEIDVFITSSPRKNPKMLMIKQRSPTNATSPTASHHTSVLSLDSNNKNRNRKNSLHQAGQSFSQQTQVQRQAYQTMNDFQKNPEQLLTTTMASKFPKVNNKRQESDLKTMHMTMTDSLSKPFTPKHNNREATNEDQSLISPSQQHQPNNMNHTTTLFGSDDFNQQQREKANQSGAMFDVNQKNMQIVDEADETDTLLNRPSFFDAMQMKVKIKQPAVQSHMGQIEQQPSNGGIKAPAVQQKNSSSPKQTYLKKFKHAEGGKDSANKTQQPYQQQRTLSSSPQSKTQLNFKKLNQKQQNLTRPPLQKASLPSYSSSPRKGLGTKTARVGGVMNAKNKPTDLKPIDHTDSRKFKPHPRLFQKYRTSLPPQSTKAISDNKPMLVDKDDQRAGAVQHKQSSFSPYQMMLEEMVNTDNNQRKKIQNMQDSIEFRDGVDVTSTIHHEGIEGQNQGGDLNDTFMAFTSRIEKMMLQTNSTTNFKNNEGLAAPNATAVKHGKFDKTGMGEGSENMTSRMNFAKMVRDEAEKEIIKKHPYFKNQPLLKHTTAKFLERKFQETDQNFKQNAQKLVDDVRKIEQLTHGSAAKQKNFNQTLLMMTQQTATLSSASASQFSATNRGPAFKNRHQSLNIVPHNSTNNSRTANIKEQLRALKLSEANFNQRNNSLTSRHGKNEFMSNTIDQQRMNQTGSSHVFQGNVSNTDVASLNSRFEVPPIGTPLTTVRHNIGDRNRRPNYHQSSNGDPMNSTGQVSYSYKRFAQDSQREHTINILPSVVKLI